MERFDYLLGLRNELLQEISGTADSTWWSRWDNSRPNYETKRKLTAILNSYVSDARNFGLLIVTRHCDCKNKRHKNYPTTNDSGKNIPYLSRDYIWEGGQLFQGLRNSRCPCSSKNEPVEHWVIDDIVYTDNCDIEFCRNLSKIFQDIASAIENAKDKMPRSGIREYLLRSIIALNDLILPESVETYIKSQKLNSHAT